MLSIRNNIVNEIVIKKSRFITFLYRVDNEKEVKLFLDNLNKEYKDATHICYAYIVDNIKRFNDDGEPSKTAGMPILNVLENNSLDHILCCVVRYFGGIKLGANGLVRAYSNSCCEIINKCDLVNLSLGKEVEITFLYDKTKMIDNILRDSIVIDKKYDSNVYYRFKISLDNYNIKYNDLISNCFSVNDLGNCYIEEEKN